MLSSQPNVVSASYQCGQPVLLPKKYTPCHEVRAGAFVGSLPHQAQPTTTCQHRQLIVDNADSPVIMHVQTVLLSTAVSGM
jgi:hypothetical protein